LIKLLICLCQNSAEFFQKLRKVLSFAKKNAEIKAGKQKNFREKGKKK